jgi:hypothetical protein
LLTATFTSREFLVTTAPFCGDTNFVAILFSASVIAIMDDDGEAAGADA